MKACRKIITLLFMIVLAQPFAGVSATEQHRFRLTDFYAGESPVRLQGLYDERTVQIPLASTYRVTEATLKIFAANSIALMEDRSILNVRFNNATIAQIAYDPNNPSLISDVTIPTSLWRSGFNSLTFAVSQHHSNQCVNSRVPELWSELDLYKSTLTMTTALSDEAPTLASLSGFFSPGVGGQRQVALYTVGLENSLLSEQTLPMVAQALALRNQYQPLTLQHKTLPPASSAAVLTDDAWTDAQQQQLRNTAWYGASGRDRIHVLVGTQDELSPYLTDRTREAINGPFLAIEATPAIVVDDKTVVGATHRLIVSGLSHEQVREAANTLAVMDDALNRDNQARIITPPSLTSAALMQADIAAADSTYTFSELGVSGEQFRGANAFSKRISLRLPADFYVPESATVTLLLDFAYGAGFGPGSAMNIAVNDELIHGLNLNEENGASFRHYQLNVPARYFKGGVNNIDLNVTMRAPLAGMPCADIPGSHMVFQLYSSSSIELPPAGGVAVQPDLALFAETAYPFSQPEASSIIVTDPGMYSSALTLAGKMAQSISLPLPSLTVTTGVDTLSGGHAIVLGSPESLAAINQSKLPSAIEKTKRWPYRLQNMLHNRVRAFMTEKAHTPLRVNGETVQENALGDLGVLVAEENKAADSSSLLVMIAAQSADVMQQRIQDLVSLELWGQLTGDFFVWRQQKEPELVMQVSDKFEVGQAGSVALEVRAWLSNNPWYWLGGFLLIVLVVSVVAYLLLRRRNKKVRQSW
ncbi:cellulose biosynthesis cyclic di-GMP-binding regulatory protein BcsB [Alteromonas sp. CYL-A6]|uniref:cellulose biosynthesis cyclic di-GMP-binding regulatory protein BcsB n=1 Tax=Alteromonas nitratireducens TaxID=3390813 RepID=UPI0034B4B1EE